MRLLEPTAQIWMKIDPYYKEPRIDGPTIKGTNVWKMCSSSVLVIALWSPEHHWSAVGALGPTAAAAAATAAAIPSSRDLLLSHMYHAAQVHAHSSFFYLSTLEVWSRDDGRLCGSLAVALCSLTFLLLLTINHIPNEVRSWWCASAIHEYHTIFV